MFEAQLCQPLLGLELRDASGLFDDCAPIVGLAREDLSDASLLDNRVRLRTQTGAHKDVLYIAQPAQLPVKQVFAFT